jgi:ketosteroid isomerase-like protein
MHWTRIMVGVLTLAAPLTGALAAGPEAEVDQIEDQRYAAMITGDLAAFAAILADEFIYHQPDGNVATKASYIEQVRSGPVKLTKAERYDVRIHVYGDVATAIGSTRLDLEQNGRPRQVDLRYLNVWVKRDGRWQLAARQSAFKPAPK